jgi:twinkle protein
MEGAVVQHDAKIIVVDPWTELQHDRERGESETEYTGRAIKVLKRFAKVFQVHLIIVAHPSKLAKVNGKYQMPSLYEINGSANWYNKCDVGIVVHRETADHTIIKVAKSRYHDIIGRPGEVQMEFCNDDRRFRENQRLA